MRVELVLEKKRKTNTLYLVAIALIITGLGLAVFSATGLVLAKSSDKTTNQANNTVTVSYSAKASLYAITEKNLIYPNGSAKITSQGALPAKLVHKSYGVFSFSVEAPPSLPLSPIKYKVVRLLNIGPFTVKLNETSGKTMPGGRVVIDLRLQEAKNVSYTLLRSIDLPVTTDMSLEIRLEATTQVANKTITMDPVIRVSLGYNEPLYRVTVTSSQGSDKITLPVKAETIAQEKALAARKRLLILVFSSGVIVALSGAALYTKTRRHEPSEILDSLTVPVIELVQPPEGYLEASSLEAIARLAERSSQPLFVVKEKQLACTILSGVPLCAKIDTEK